VYPKLKEEVAGSWRRLHNKKLYKLYALPYIIMGEEVKEGMIDGACSTHGRS
jgi:hypothetical protein